jgi:hypothetical protein
MSHPTIDDFRRSLDEQTLRTVDALRNIIAAAHPELTEHVKWNAPSFALAGQDRITLGVERRGGVRVVLHRGAKPKDAANFIFSDPAGLANWPTGDRGVIVFRDSAQVADMREQLRDLCTRWLAATP